MTNKQAPLPITGVYENGRSTFLYNDSTQTHIRIPILREDGEWCADIKVATDTLEEIELAQRMLAEYEVSDAVVYSGHPEGEDLVATDQKIFASATVAKQEGN